MGGASTNARGRGGQVGLFKALRRTARYHIRDGLGLRIKPIKLRLALTNRCNARCIMCSVWQFQDNTAPSLPSEITVEEIERLARANRDFFSKVDHVSLTGGEPTLRRDFVQVVRALDEHLPGRSISFNSNGFNTRLILDLVGRCLAFREQLTVMISLDAIGPGHSVIRGMGGDVGKAVERTIDRLVELRRDRPRLKLQVNTVMTNENNDQLLPVFRFCREREISFNPIYITYGQLYQNQSADQSSIQLSEQSRARLIRDAEAILRQEPGLQLYEAINLLRRGRRDFDCWAGKLMFLIEENCDVFPNGGCPAEFNLGNLRDHDFSFQSLLSSDRARSVLARVNDCRLCQIPCEFMPTLNHAEALTGRRKALQIARFGAGQASLGEDPDLD